MTALRQPVTRIDVTAERLERLWPLDPRGTVQWIRLASRSEDAEGRYYRLAWVQQWVESMFVYHDRVWITGLRVVVEGDRCCHLTVSL